MDLIVSVPEFTYLLRTFSSKNYRREGVARGVGVGC